MRDEARSQWYLGNHRMNAYSAADRADFWNQLTEGIVFYVEKVTSIPETYKIVARPRSMFRHLEGEGKTDE